MAFMISHDYKARSPRDMYYGACALQKLLVTIDSSQRERVREYQRRCEEALTDVLLKGAAPPVGSQQQTLAYNGLVIDLAELTTAEV